MSEFTPSYWIRKYVPKELRSQFVAEIIRRNPELEFMKTHEFPRMHGAELSEILRKVTESNE